MLERCVPERVRGEQGGKFKGVVVGSSIVGRFAEWLSANEGLQILAVRNTTAL